MVWIEGEAIEVDISVTDQNGILICHHLIGLRQTPEVHYNTVQEGFLEFNGEI